MFIKWTFWISLLLVIYICNFFKSNKQNMLFYYIPNFITLYNCLDMLLILLTFMSSSYLYLSLWLCMHLLYSENYTYIYILHVSLSPWFSFLYCKTRYTLDFFLLFIKVVVQIRRDFRIFFNQLIIIEWKGGKVFVQYFLLTYVITVYCEDL